MKKLQKLMVLLLSVIMLSGMSQQQLTSKITSDGVQGFAQRGPTAFESCPPASVFSQEPTLQDNVTWSWSAYTSDDNSMFTYLVYENFSGITQPITAVHFWGMKLYYAGGWNDCTGENSVVFNVKFYQDNAGSPGDLVESESINIYEDNTGLYGGTLYHYLAVLETPVNLPAGWISIQGTVSLNSDDCVFLWMNSPTGDGSGLQSPTGPIYDNLSLCIETASGPIPETPVSPWALAIGIFLIAGSIILRYRR